MDMSTYIHDDDRGLSSQAVVHEPILPWAKNARHLE